jgi:hypothetical protein
VSSQSEEPGEETENQEQNQEQRPEVLTGAERKIRSRIRRRNSDREVRRNQEKPDGTGRLPSAPPVALTEI